MRFKFNNIFIIKNTVILIVRILNSKNIDIMLKTIKRKSTKKR
jgi:hypothetical protein